MLMKKGKINVCGVYGIFTKDDECKYIGSSKEVNDAYSRHKSNLNNGEYVDTNKQVLQDLYNKEDLYFKVLEICKEYERVAKETIYIKQYKKTSCNSDGNGKARTSSSTEEETLKRRNANAGEKNPHNTKLSEDDVIQIKLYIKNRTYRDRELAKMYNVSLSHINNIRKGFRWKSVVIDNIDLIKTKGTDIFDYIPVPNVHHVNVNVTSININLN